MPTPSTSQPTPKDRTAQVLLRCQSSWLHLVNTQGHARTLVAVSTMSTPVTSQPSLAANHTAVAPSPQHRSCTERREERAGAYAQPQSVGMRALRGSGTANGTVSRTATGTVLQRLRLLGVQCWLYGVGCHA